MTSHEGKTAAPILAYMKLSRPPSLTASTSEARTAALHLTQCIRGAHHLACDENPVAQILLLDLIRDAVTIEQRISILLSAIEIEPVADSDAMPIPDTEFHPVPHPQTGDETECDLPFLSERSAAEIRREQEAIRRAIERITADPAQIDATLARIGLLPA
jgi:hypothetical protein